MDTFFKKAIWLVIVSPLVYLACIWNTLPASIPVHFNISGNPDRFGSRNELMAMTLILTLLNTGVYLMLTYVYLIDPKKIAATNQVRLQRIGMVTAIFLAAVLCLIIYSTVQGSMKAGAAIIFSGIGMLYCVIGNYMHNMRPNYFAGIRVPWALENEENWRKTHRLAGRLFFAGGLVMAITCLFTPHQVSLFVVLGITLAITIIPAVYSYRLHKKQKAITQ